MHKKIEVVIDKVLVVKLSQKTTVSGDHVQWSLPFIIIPFAYIEIGHMVIWFRITLSKFQYFATSHCLSLEQTTILGWECGYKLVLK